jgi:hypothetical protein
MKALILIQDELINKLDAIQALVGEGQGKKPDDRIIVLCIAYHNIAVEQEFLKQVRNDYCLNPCHFYSIKQL